MIITFLLEITGRLIRGLLTGAKIVSVPVDLIATLNKVMAYGADIVGLDLLLVIASSVMFWISIRAAVGLFKWGWELLPFT
jgi:hypothetical protein